jgi:hypothetical protein
MVIARYADGRIVKGTTSDFSPGKDFIHMRVASTVPGSPPATVRLRDLKLLAFVKDLEGDPRRRTRPHLRPFHRAAGRLVKVTFADGEVIVGTTATYQPNRPWFFLEPAAEDANETRIYVPTEATQEVAVLE